MESFLETFLERSSLEPTQQHKAVTCVPLLRTDGTGPAYITLSEALQRSTLTVTEISVQASVPDLLVANCGDLPVLVLDGEELAGAKQNRVLNTSVLLSAHSETIIPVSCTEHGRWSRRRRFTNRVMCCRVNCGRNARHTYDSLCSSQAFTAPTKERCGMASIALLATSACTQTPLRWQTSSRRTNGRLTSLRTLSPLLRDNAEC